MAIIKINQNDLIHALSSDVESQGGAWYLDAETGGILLDFDGGEDDLPKDLQTNSRYIVIEAIPAHQSFQFMEDFVDELGERDEATILRNALSQRKPFRHFKDALDDFPELQDAWFAFEHLEYVKLAEEWCAEYGLEVEWG